MKKRLVMCLLAFALAATCSVTLYAQENSAGGQQGGGERGEHRMGGQRGGMMGPQARLDRLTKELNLTKDQQDKIKPILEDEQKQMEELRSSSGGQRPDFEKMRDIRKSHDEQIRGVLTSDQQTKYDEMQKKMMERGGPGGRRGGDRPNGGEGGGTPPPPQL